MSTDNSTPFNQILLTDREEMNQLFGKELSDKEWDQVREWITTDDQMWEAVDECMLNMMQDLKHQWERSNG